MKLSLFLIILTIIPQTLTFNISPSFVVRNKSNLLVSLSTESNDGEVRLEDRDVPAAHAGLHNDLYGDGEVHGAESDLPPPPPPTLTEGRVWDYSMLLKGLEGSGGKVAAVYAISETKEEGWGNVGHVGITRNLAVSLRAHLNNDKTNPSSKFVRAVSFTYPQRTAMEELAGKWESNASLGPPSTRPDWATTVKDAAESGMTEGERKDFEQKKKKMRQAMADTTLIDEREKEETDPDVERIRMMRASGYLLPEDDDDEDFGDDWSAVIDQQTSETVESSSSPSTPETIASPFADGGGEAAGESPTPTSDGLEFNEKNVDQVLNEVRPYLIADGGNVAVSSIDVATRSVYLVLQGACGSCPSSTVTMKMGIERVLKENFGNIGEVKQVDDPAAGARKELTREAVEDSVGALTPAINAMGGAVEVVDVTPLGVVKLNFRGSNKIRYGLELAIQDLPMVKHVEFVE